MKAKYFVKKIMELNPDDDTDIDLLLDDDDSEIYDFLNIKDICRNEDCSGINAIGIVLKLSHKLD